jgi:hypothetical protein
MLRTTRILVTVASPFILAATILGMTRLFSSRSLPALVAPLLTVEPKQFVAHANAGETVTADFVVQNDTRQAVKLIGDSCDCSCVSVENSFPIDVGPNSTVKIRVTLAVPRAVSNTYEKQFTFLANRAGLIPTVSIQAIIATSTAVPSQ